MLLMLEAHKTAQVGTQLVTTACATSHVHCFYARESAGNTEKIGLH